MIPWPKKAKKIQFLISSNHNQPSPTVAFTQAFPFKTMPSSRVSNSGYFKERRRGLLLKITFFCRHDGNTHPHFFPLPICSGCLAFLDVPGLKDSAPFFFPLGSNKFHLAYSHSKIRLIPVTVLGKITTVRLNNIF